MALACNSQAAKAPVKSCPLALGLWTQRGLLILAALPGLGCGGRPKAEAEASLTSRLPEIAATTQGLLRL